MEVRTLRYFLAVAREGSITRAANFLHLTQPTLSRQMQDLEQELGRQLLVRKSHRVDLTPEGVMLRKRAEEIVAMVDKTEAEFIALEDTVSGDIYIGSGETRALCPIAGLIRQLREECPGIRYHLYSGNAQDVTDRLDKGMLDFGILIQPADIAKYDGLSLPAKDVWGVLMRRDDPLARKEAICPQDLWKRRLILSHQQGTEEQISGWLRRNVTRLQVVATYNLVFNASLMVEEGLGYALCFDQLINVSGDSPLCFRPLSPPMRSEASIIWKRYQVFSKASECFLKQLKGLLTDQETENSPETV